MIEFCLLVTEFSSGGKVSGERPEREPWEMVIYVDGPLALKMMLLLASYLNLLLDDPMKN